MPLPSYTCARVCAHTPTRTVLLSSYHLTFWVGSPFDVLFLPDAADFGKEHLGKVVDTLAPETCLPLSRPLFAGTP